MCKRWEGEGDPSLELEVLEFMKNSKNPEMFPSKRELIEAGKMDLVEAIVKEGGWMLMGWEGEMERMKENEDDGLGSDWKFEKEGQNGCEGEGRRGGSELEERENLECISPVASSSGRSIEKLEEDDSGIEGILNRLERQRSLRFGLNLGENGSVNHVSGNIGEDEQSAEISRGVDSCRPDRSKPSSSDRGGQIFSNNGLNRSYSNVVSSPFKEDSWRSWSIQRAGYSDTEFEAAEFDFGGNTKGRTVDTPMGGIIARKPDIMDPLDETKDLNSCVEEIAQTDIKTRLKYLEVELSSALSSLRSNTSDLSEKAKEHLSEDLRQLSDASEFQENEIMNAQDKLRSIRAKLAVLQGKMSLALTDAQKILDEKQKRIEAARGALQLLHTVCIVWPNSGSEVLLAGSFDGWTTQRKMERSSTGIFSLCLKLYPGKYEIKFIVDGSWKVDPLRPVVNNNGFENNLLIIT